MCCRRALTCSLANWMRRGRFVVRDSVLDNGLEESNGRDAACRISIPRRRAAVPRETRHAASLRICLLGETIGPTRRPPSFRIAGYRPNLYWNLLYSFRRIQGLRKRIRSYRIRTLSRRLYSADSGQLLSAHSQPRRTASCRLLRLSGWRCRTVHRDLPDFRDLRARSFGSGHAAHVEPYSRDVVGPWPWSPALAILRRGTRSPAPASTFPDFLCGRPDGVVASRQARARLNLPEKTFTCANGDSARGSCELWEQLWRSSLRSSPEAVWADNRPRCRTPDTSDCRAAYICRAAPNAEDGP